MKKLINIFLIITLVGCSKNMTVNDFLPNTVESIIINNFEYQNIILKNDLVDDFIRIFSKIPLYQYEEYEQYQAVGQSVLEGLIGETKFVESGYVLYINDVNYCYNQKNQNYTGDTIYSYCNEIVSKINPYTIYGNDYPTTIYLTIYSYESNDLSISYDNDTLFIYNYDNLIKNSSPLLNFGDLGLKAYENNVEINELPKDKGVHKIIFKKDNISFIFMYECLNS